VLEENYKIRTFSEDVSEDELIWHRDKNDREITVIEGSGWKLQMDNKLPEDLQKGKLYNINKMEFHRLIKGEDTLKIKIWEK
jgi:quercetin dioxygenase-like cupin family protein